MNMTRRLIALVPCVLLLPPGSLWASPDGGPGARWEEAVEPGTAKIVIRNLGSRPAAASLGATRIALPADGAVEISAAAPAAGELNLSSDAALLVLQAPYGFESASLDVDTGTLVHPVTIRRTLHRDGWPGRRRELVVGADGIRHGVTGTAGIASDDPESRVELVVEFLAPHTLVRIRQLDLAGNEVAALVASASRPVRWRATLDFVRGESRIELQTLRGEARGTAAADAQSAAAHGKPSPIDPPITSLSGGLAKYEPTINWQYSANLYYKIIGAPASVCGDIYVSRNGGSYVVTPGWVCTNSSGNATKGPWLYANQSGDEDAYAYVIWPGGSSTNTARHIWDKTAPLVSITSPSGLPAPASLSGTANDGSYGSGFSASFGSAAGGGSSLCRAQFKNTSTGKYWCSGNSTYGSSVACVVGCTISGMPARSVSWSANDVPPGSAHLSGECYEWKATVYDNYNLGKSGATSRFFCVPL